MMAGLYLNRVKVADTDSYNEHSIKGFKYQYYIIIPKPSLHYYLKDKIFYNSNVLGI